MYNFVCLAMSEVFDYLDVAMTEMRVRQGGHGIQINKVPTMEFISKYLQMMLFCYLNQKRSWLEWQEVFIVCVARRC